MFHRWDWDKSRLVELARAEHDFLLRTLALLDESQLSQPGACGEAWSVKDVLAHITAWEQKVIGWVEAGQRGEKSDRPEGGYSEEALDRENDAIYRANKDRPFDAVRADFDASFTQFVALIESFSEQALAAPDTFEWTRADAPLAMFFTYNTHDHYYEHAVGIRKWAGVGAHSDWDKRRVLDLTRIERDFLARTIAPLDEPHVLKPGACGEVWSVKDVLAHVAAWQRLCVGWIEAGKRGETPEVPAPGYTFDDTDRLNDDIYTQHKDQSLDAVRADFEHWYGQMLALVENLSDDELFSPDAFEWTYRRDPLALYVAHNSYIHDNEHAVTIHKWLDR